MMLLAHAADAKEQDPKPRAKPPRMCEVKIKDSDRAKYNEYLDNWRKYSSREDVGKSMAAGEYYDWLTKKYCAATIKKIINPDGSVKIQSAVDAEVQRDLRTLRCPCSKVIRFGR